MVPGFDGALERLRERPALVRGEHVARAPGIDVPGGAVGDLADGRGDSCRRRRGLVVAAREDLAQHEDGPIGR